MSQEEYDRLIETLFYLYFDNKDSKVLSSNLFWNMIKAVCALYDINDRAIIQAIRILMADENVPQEEETYYLLSKIGLTVRPIRTISGIYWQKQKAYNEKFEKETPVIKRRLTDIIYKKSIRDFVFAIYDTSGIFKEISMDKVFK